MFYLLCQKSVQWSSFPTKLNPKEDKSVTQIHWISLVLPTEAMRCQIVDFLKLFDNICEPKFLQFCCQWMEARKNFHHLGYNQFECQDSIHPNGRLSASKLLQFFWRNERLKVKNEIYFDIATNRSTNTHRSRRNVRLSKIRCSKILFHFQLRQEKEKNLFNI